MIGKRIRSRPTTVWQWIASLAAFVVLAALGPLIQGDGGALLALFATGVYGGSVAWFAATRARIVGPLLAAAALVAALFVVAGFWAARGAWVTYVDGAPSPTFNAVGTWREPTVGTVPGEVLVARQLAVWSPTAERVLTLEVAPAEPEPTGRSWYTGPPGVVDVHRPPRTSEVGFSVAADAPRSAFAAQVFEFGEMPSDRVGASSGSVRVLLAGAMVRDAAARACPTVVFEVDGVQEAFHAVCEPAPSVLVHRFESGTRRVGVTISIPAGAEVRAAPARIEFDDGAIGDTSAWVAAPSGLLVAWASDAPRIELDRVRLALAAPETVALRAPAPTAWGWGASHVRVTAETEGPAVVGRPHVTGPGTRSVPVPVLDRSSLPGQHPNLTGHGLVILWLAAWVVAARRGRAIAVLALAVSPAIVLTGSRSALLVHLIALVAISVATAVRRPEGRRGYVLGVVAVALVLALLLPVTRFGRPSVDEVPRSAIWSASLDDLATQPWLGDADTRLTVPARDGGTRVVAHPHNFVLWAWSRFGAGGALGALIVLVVPLAAAVRVRRDLPTATFAVAVLLFNVQDVSWTSTLVFPAVAACLGWALTREGLA